MAKEEEKSFKLSYESDGEMGDQQKGNAEKNIQHKRGDQGFHFNVTQNSE